MDDVAGLCPSWALSVGYLGVASAAVLSNWGSAVSTQYALFFVRVNMCSAVDRS